MDIGKVIEAAETLNEYCQFTRCNSCIFSMYVDDGFYDCTIPWAWHKSTIEESDTIE